MIKKRVGPRLLDGKTIDVDWTARLRKNTSLPLHDWRNIVPGVKEFCRPLPLSCNEGLVDTGHPFGIGFGGTSFFVFAASIDDDAIVPFFFIFLPIIPPSTTVFFIRVPLASVLLALVTLLVMAVLPMVERGACRSRLWLGAACD
jgi:hypothetical protein